MRALREYWAAAAIGAVPGVAFGGLAWTHTAGWFLGLCLVLALVALLAGVALLVAAAASRDLTRALPANGYGLCSGMTAAFANISAASDEPRASQPLTYWLTKYLN